MQLLHMEQKAMVKQLYEKGLSLHSPQNSEHPMIQ